MNEHWHIINEGKQKVSNTPEQLWEAAVGYFKWCDENPISEKRTLLSGKTQGAKIEVEHTRPYTIKAFCLHANISEKYIKDLIDCKAGNEWAMVIEKILYIIYNQNLEGGLIDQFNPIMVSKVLNMDKENDKGNDPPPRVEIVEGQTKQLANSENEILENLDYGKVEQLKEKIENSKEQNS